MVFFEVRRALGAARERFGFRLVHFSVQRDHVHLLAEAQDRRALARGVQGLSIRVARAVNRRAKRSGRVFADRYHVRALKTPREARAALVYVLMNARKHARGRGRLAAGFADFCSSAAWFAGWRRPRELVFGLETARSRKRLPHEFVGMHSGVDAPAPVVPPRTWLLRVGFLRRGAIDPDEAPA